jgi:hypothetical protein
MHIRINKVTDPHAWYAEHVGKVLPVERVEINRRPDQGIPEDVYWCREGGTYNAINYVRKSDATELVENEEHKEAFMAERRARHGAWLAQPMGRSEWLELLVRCQSGDCTCFFAMEKIEHELDKAAKSSPEAHMLLRSAHAIATREGRETNWQAFYNGVQKELLAQAGAPGSTDEQTILRATCTPRTYRQIPDPET